LWLLAISPLATTLLTAPALSAPALTVPARPAPLLIAPGLLALPTIVAAADHESPSPQSPGRIAAAVVGANEPPDPEASPAIAPRYAAPPSGTTPATSPSAAAQLTDTPVDAPVQAPVPDQAPDQAPVQAPVQLPAPVEPPSSAAADLPVDAPVAAPVSFASDVRPILERHCVGCHGPDRQEGSLRLDRLEFAQRGGHTGRPVLGGTVETNALLQRVTSTDESLRMPKGAPPLTEPEVDILRRWIAAGSSGDDGPSVPRARPIEQTVYALRWPSLADLDPRDWSNSAQQRFLWWYLRFGPPIIGLLLFIGLCERCRQWVRDQRPCVTPPRGAWLRRCAAVRRRDYLLLLALCGLILGLVYYQEQARRADADIAGLQQTVDDLQRQLDPALPGADGVLRPVHPRHPPRLGGEYYRGNDERSPQLFNGGFYRTCVMRVWLVDADDRILHWGDPAPLTGAALRFEIEQAPGAVDALFTPDIWASTFVSPVPKLQKIADLTREVGRFEEQGDRRWVARLPFDLQAAREVAITGIVYIHRGEPRLNAAIEGDPHYAAEYSIRLDGDRIAADSELWLGYIFRTGGVLPVPPGRIAEDEWFSFRPIPEIVGGHATSDRKLLGIEDHKPSGQPTGDQPAADQPPDDRPSPR